MTQSRPAALLTALLAAACALGAWAQGPSPTGKPSVSTKEPIRASAVRNAPPTRAEAKPTWAELSVQQQQALAPLAGSWRSMGETQKRKWLALSQNFHTMPAEEQARLHSRMTDWATLSPQQRTAARLNFAEAQKVSPADKRAKWEAYQALPPEEKKRLAAGHQAAKPPPPPTAVAVKPATQHKLARISRTRKGEVPARLTIVPGPPVNNALLPPPAAGTQP